MQTRLRPPGAIAGLAIVRRGSRLRLRRGRSRHEFGIVAAAPGQSTSITILTRPNGTVTVVCGG